MSKENINGKNNMIGYQVENIALKAQLEITRNSFNELTTLYEAEKQHHTKLIDEMSESLKDLQEEFQNLLKITKQ